MRYFNSNVYDILVDQGSTLHRALFLKTSAKKPIDLSGYIGRMHIRDSKDSSVIVQILTTENSEIIVNELLGRVDILLPPADTESFEAKDYVYDLELESLEGDVTKIISGKLTVRAEVTF